MSYQQGEGIDRAKIRIPLSTQNNDFNIVTSTRSSSHPAIIIVRGQIILRSSGFAKYIGSMAKICKYTSL